jgi:hypothetical protein
MAQTTNYNFEIPDDTDLVKDGALAMRDLGQDVDTTLATALNANDYSGLVLLKTQTIGSAVSLITVTDAFSATYENYKIIYTNYVNSGFGAALYFRLGASTTNYQTNGITISTAGAVSGVTGIGSTLTFGYTNTVALQSEIEVYQPFLTSRTGMKFQTYSSNQVILGGGSETNSASYTSFNLTAQSAQTFTGGTIYVYGYGAS